MKFTDISNVVIHDLHLLNNKSFHIGIFKSQGVQLYNVNIMAPGDSPNTYGIHISSSANINITTSTIGIGDDCVSIGEGTNDIFVSGIFCGPGHGIRMLIGLGGIGKNVVMKGMVKALPELVAFIDVSLIKFIDLHGLIVSSG